MASFQVAIALRQLGHDIRDARKRRRLSVADFCTRIGTTDKTLAKLERGEGGVRVETVAAALLALGVLDRLEHLLDPSGDELGLSLDRSRLPQRIVSPRRKKAKQDEEAPSGGASNDLNDGVWDDEGSAF